MSLDDVIQRLRELSEPVPMPQRLPTVQEVEIVEQILNIKFHLDYRKYLLEASHVVYGTLEPATVTPDDSYTNLINITQNGRKYMELPEDLIPICEDNGDYFCMKPDGQVVYWSHNGTTNEKWPDLATWIQEVWIKESQGWLE